jgi:diguanylate cyclase (GGDEF)-like protein/PAS domain S-box-containing protein
MLGRAEGSLSGLAFDELVHPDDRGTLHLDRLAAGEAAEHQIEMRYLTGRGGDMWGNTIASAVRGGGGPPRFLIVMVEDITLRKAHEAVLEHRALHDPLTDLPNRSLLQDRLQQAILAARRDHEVGALLIIDLDGFKAVNDQYGHACGDALLKQIGARVRAGLRSSDTVARLGGDEFAVVLPKIGGEGGASRAVTKLRAALEQPFEAEGHRVSVSASIGVALFPSHAIDPDELMRRADGAMYETKRSR